MKKFNRGITLVEIIVSLALISSIMIFMFSILSDIKNDNKFIESRSLIANTKSVVTQVIQNDFLEYDLIGLKTEACDPGEKCYTFTYEDASPKKLTIGSDYIIYGKQKWNFKNDKDIGSFDINNIVIKAVSSKDYYTSFSISIPYNFNKMVSLDGDIEIVYNKPYNSCLRRDLEIICPICQLGDTLSSEEITTCNSN